MVAWECPTNPREASGLDPEAVHDPLRKDRDETVTDAVGTDRRALHDHETSVAPLSVATSTVDHDRFGALDTTY